MAGHIPTGPSVHCTVSMIRHVDRFPSSLFRVCLGVKEKAIERTKELNHSPNVSSFFLSFFLSFSLCLLVFATADIAHPHGVVVSIAIVYIYILLGIIEMWRREEELEEMFNIYSSRKKNPGAVARRVEKISHSYFMCVGELPRKRNYYGGSC